MQSLLCGRLQFTLPIYSGFNILSYSSTHLIFVRSLALAISMLFVRKKQYANGLDAPVAQFDDWLMNFEWQQRTNASNPLYVL